MCWQQLLWAIAGAWRGRKPAKMEERALPSEQPRVDRGTDRLSQKGNEMVRGEPWVLDVFTLGSSVTLESSVYGGVSASLSF